jgi:hypothetical protein
MHMHRSLCFLLCNVYRMTHLGRLALRWTGVSRGAMTLSPLLSPRLTSGVASGSDIHPRPLASPGRHGTGSHSNSIRSIHSRKYSLLRSPTRFCITLQTFEFAFNETFKIDPVPETSGWRSRLEHRGHAACHFRHLDTTREQYPANLKYTKSNVFHVAVSLVLQHLADLR